MTLGWSFSAILVGASPALAQQTDAQWTVISTRATDSSEEEILGNKQMGTMGWVGLGTATAWSLLAEVSDVQVRESGPPKWTLGAELWVTQWRTDLGYPRTDTGHAYMWSVETDLGTTPYLGISATGGGERLRGGLEALIARSDSGGRSPSATARRAAQGLAHIEGRLGDDWWLASRTTAGSQRATFDTLSWTPGIDGEPGIVADDQTDVTTTYLMVDSLLRRQAAQFSGWSDSFVTGIGYRYARYGGLFINSVEQTSSSVPSAVLTERGTAQAHCLLLTVATPRPESLWSPFIAREADMVIVPYGDWRFAVGGGPGPSSSFAGQSSAGYGSVELESGVAARIANVSWWLGYRTSQVEVWSRSGSQVFSDGGIQLLNGVVIGAQANL